MSSSGTCLACECHRCRAGANHSVLHGMSACRWRRDDDWKICRMQSVLDHTVQSSSFNFDWQMVARPVMQLYTESTDGSYIEEKESALVWHHRFADPDFGAWQAKELQDHLESVLANEAVTVKSGAQIVEVTPQVCIDSIKANVMTC